MRTGIDLSARKQHLDVVVLIECESVVDSCGQHDHVPFPAVDADPAVLRVPNIKVTCMHLPVLPTTSRAFRSHKINDWTWAHDLSGSRSHACHGTPALRLGIKACIALRPAFLANEQRMYPHCSHRDQRHPPSSLGTRIKERCMWTGVLM